MEQYWRILRVPLKRRSTQWVALAGYLQFFTIKLEVEVRNNLRATGKTQAERFNRIRQVASDTVQDSVSRTCLQGQLRMQTRLPLNARGSLMKFDQKDEESNELQNWI